MADNQGPQDPVRFRSYSPRIDVHEEATLIEGSGTEHDVVLIDISRDGFRIKHGNPALAPGPATLRLERYGDMDIQIMWIRSGEAGGLFLEGAPEIL